MYLVCRLLLATHRTSLYTLSLHDALPILSKRKIPQIDPVDFDLPGLGIVKATEQLEKRGLAGAIGAHDSHGTARGNRHTEVPQSHPIGAGISKRDISEPDALFQGRRGWKWVRGVDNARLEIQEFEQVHQKQAVGVNLTDVCQESTH